MDDRQQVRSLKKALRILRIMNEMGDATVLDVAGTLGLPRTTAYRLLETLETEGFVQHQPHSSIYRLTSKVLELASGFQNQNLLLEIASPLITELGAKIGWSLSLATPRAAEMVTRITTNHDTTLALERYTIGLGVPMLHATTGFCYLAFCSEMEREIAIGMARASGDPLQSLARNRTKLDAVLERVRTRGFCNLEFSQYREGNVGVPLLTGDRPLGGIVMRYIKSAMTAQKLLNDYIPQLTDLSSKISSEYLAKTGGSDWHSRTRTELQDQKQPEKFTAVVEGINI
jgi:IclR family mhp operon transcriptional activator